MSRLATVNARIAELAAIKRPSREEYAEFFALQRERNAVDRAQGSLVLRYREPGARPGSTRWARRPVASVADAIAWMNRNREQAFLPASVETKAWTPQVVAILS